VAPPDSVNELLQQVYESEARSYLLAIVLGVILCIFIGGLLCGRVTKRVKRQMKDRWDCWLANQRPPVGRCPLI